MLGHLWIDRKYNILYFTPLGKDIHDSWWLGTYEHLKQHLSQGIINIIEKGGEAPVNLDLVEGNRKNHGEYNGEQ